MARKTVKIKEPFMCDSHYLVPLNKKMKAQRYVREILYSCKKSVNLETQFNTCNVYLNIKTNSIPLK